jgi:methyltransferase (TIGR00027 family)
MSSGILGRTLYGPAMRMAAGPTVKRVNMIDVALREALRLETRHVVVLGAGFDVRAFRFGVTGTRFYEIDLPHVVVQKKKLITRLIAQRPDLATHTPTLIAADLTIAADLNRVGLELNQLLGNSSSVWLSEAVLMYLPTRNAVLVQEWAARLMSDGSRWIMYEGDEPRSSHGMLRGVDLALMPGMGLKRREQQAGFSIFEKC